jgi:hypothetical protein
MRWRPKRGIICGQAEDQLLNIVVEWRMAWSTGIGGWTGDKAAMNEQQGLGFDQGAEPAGPWQRAADGKWGAVAGLKPGSWNLDPQDGELVAQYQDLQVLGSVTANEQSEQLDAPARCKVAEFGEH